MLDQINSNSAGHRLTPLVQQYNIKVLSTAAVAPLLHQRAHWLTATTYMCRQLQETVHSESVVRSVASLGLLAIQSL